MSSKENDTYSRIRSKLADYECEVPQSCWDAIESRISRKRRLKRHRRMAGWSVALAAATVAGILFFFEGNRTELPVEPRTADNSNILPHLNNGSAKDSVQLFAGNGIAEAKVKETVKYIASASTGKGMPETKISNIRGRDRGMEERTQDDTRYADESIERSDSDDIRHDCNEIAPRSESGNVKAGNTSNADTADINSLLKLYKDSKPNRLVAKTEKERYVGAETDNGISVSLVAANALNANARRERDLSQNNMPLHEELRLYSNEEQLKFKHKMPISAGITVEKRWKNDWGIESGIMYTLLRSTYSTESNTQQGEQELHYIGIPVNVTYRFAQVKMLGFYAAAGPKIDFNVSGKRTESIENSYAKSNASESVRDKKPQFSLQLRLGVACTIVNHLELYVEPSLAYYIDNKGDIPDLWKERPLNFVLQFGLRTGF